jgi:thioredoxin reductase (NADPH)
MDVESTYNYDLFIIGGGPGGNAAAKEASNYNKKIGLADFVEPSPFGTTWGLGGTCVNVGCIPKKMMHYAGSLYDQMKYFPLIGNKELTKEFKWDTLRENVQGHISALNFGYRGQLRKNKVTYYNKFAKFKDTHTLELVDKKGNVETVTADKILISTGLRPTYVDVPGAKECCITSDDIFKLKKAPGKTLIIGASYIAVECASFLKSFGYDVTIMVRSILLRGFDRDMADRLQGVLQRDGIKFLNKCVPMSFIKNEDKIICEYKNSDTGETNKEEFDTVLLAVGRKADCAKINIESTGVNLAKSGKIIVDEFEKTNVDNIYAIGDIAEGRPELAPPAIKAGKLLAKRLFGGKTEIVNYENIATTVYAKIEYGTCGLTEEKAIEKFGKENIKVYHTDFVPVEWTFDIENEESCYIKIIVNTSDSNRVVGWHILSTHAGEITQGISVAMNCGLTKEKLDQTIGIHPTIAEEMTTIEVEKGVGDGKKTGC